MQINILVPDTQTLWLDTKLEIRILIGLILSILVENIMRNSIAY